MEMITDSSSQAPNITPLGGLTLNMLSSKFSIEIVLLVLKDFGFCLPKILFIVTVQLCPAMHVTLITVKPKLMKVVDLV